MDARFMKDKIKDNMMMCSPEEIRGDSQIKSKKKKI